MTTGDGHYLLLAKTSQRPGYFARFISSFLNTTDKCIRFYYRFLGNRSTVSVILRNVELKEFPLSNLSWYEPSFDLELTGLCIFSTCEFDVLFFVFLLLFNLDISPYKIKWFCIDSFFKSRKHLLDFFFFFLFVLDFAGTFL